MTPPDGSRDGDADNDPRGEAEPGRVPGDQSDGDDPRLRAMRAVWLAMREEEPPDRGMTELLAAARRKAEAMQPPPSAWQRLLAALRRPPALALATAMVLIAGAVLIGRRLPHEPAPGPTAAPKAAGPPRSAAIGTGSGSPNGAGAAAEARSTGETTSDQGGATTAPVPHPTEPPATPTARPLDRDIRPAPPASVATTPARRSSSSGGAPRHGDDHTATSASPSVPADPAPEPASPPPEGVTRLGAAAAVPGAATATGELYRQCEAAAQRGDCAAARRLVDRISRTDPGYRARLAKDSPVGRCLAE